MAAGFWNVRAYAWSFGNFIALFTMIFGFFAILGASTLEAESGPMLVAIIIFFYLNYPGVRNAFMEHELALMTPEQRAAMQQMQAAQLAMAQASVAPAAAAPRRQLPRPSPPPRRLRRPRPQASGLPRPRSRTGVRQAEREGRSAQAGRPFSASR